jgi:hypothetical protein
MRRGHDHARRPEGPASLTCSCGRSRGSLTEFTGKWIEAIAAKFGAPAMITLRHTPIPPVEPEQPPDNAGTSTENLK